MYHYDYETDVLLMLRLAKYLHRQNPAALKGALEDFPDFDLCLLFELSERIIWEICTDVVFDTDDEYEISFCTFRHPVISRFCALGSDWSSAQGRSAGAWQRKLSDIAEYFLRGTSYSLVGLACYPEGCSAKLRTWFSSDCYESGEFGNALVDMLLFLQRENERLEGMLKNEKTAREEAA